MSPWWELFQGSKEKQKLYWNSATLAWLSLCQRFYQWSHCPHPPNSCLPLLPKPVGTATPCIHIRQVRFLVSPTSRPQWPQYCKQIQLQTQCGDHIPPDIQPGQCSAPQHQLTSPRLVPGRAYTPHYPWPYAINTAFKKYPYWWEYGAAGAEWLCHLTYSAKGHDLVQQNKILLSKCKDQVSPAWGPLQEGDKGAVPLGGPVYQRKGHTEVLCDHLAKDTMQLQKKLQEDMLQREEAQSTLKTFR